MPQVAVPIFTPPGGSYETDRESFGIRVIEPTQSSFIAWTDDGTDPVPRTHGHQSPQVFGYRITGHLQTVTVTLKAIGYRDGYTDSAMVTQVYTVTFVPAVPPPRPVSPPMFDPRNGQNLTFPITVHITENDSQGAIIIYTENDDNAPPGPNNGVQDGQILDLVLTGDTTLRAVGWRQSDGRVSSIMVGVYTGSSFPLSPPEIHPPGGDNIDFPFNIAIVTDAPGAIVIYTLNDSTEPPSWTHGIRGTAHVEVTLVGNTTVRAIAAVDADTFSDVAIAVFSGPGGGGEPPPFLGEGGITVVVSDQDTIFGGVLVQPFSGTPIFGQIPIAPIPPIEGPIVVPAGASMIYRPEIVSLTGPASPSLQSFPAANLALDTLIIITLDSQQQSWRIDPGAADPADPGQIAPLDYNALTNNKHYIRVL